LMFENQRVIKKMQVACRVSTAKTAAVITSNTITDI